MNCVLALKSYDDWKRGGGNGLWKFGGNLKPITFGKYFVRKNSEPFMSSLRNLTSEKSLDSISSEQSLCSDLGNDLNEMVSELYCFKYFMYCLTLLSWKSDRLIF